ncbi:MAG TPA: hypothetical protein VGL71_11890 [Urbifossiella sp.]|jgi:hypothetical protein
MRLDSTSGFTPAWFEAGVISQESLEEFAGYAARDSTKSARHWRWIAFRDFVEERCPLSAEQCRALFQLGESEADANLGAAMMCGILHQSTCPTDVVEKAEASDCEAVRRLAARRHPKNPVAVPAPPPKS